MESLNNIPIDFWHFSFDIFLNLQKHAIKKKFWFFVTHEKNIAFCIW